MIAVLPLLWRKRLVLHLAVLVIYVLMTVLALDYLLLHFAEALPRDEVYHDYAIFCWDMWWMRYAMLELRTNPLETDFIVYPFTHSLVLHVFTLFWDVLSIPLQLYLDINVILNTFIVVSFLLTAYFTFLFVRYHGSPWSLSVLAGVLVGFCPATVRRAVLGHINILPMWWIPLSLLAFDLTCCSRRVVSAVLLAVCLYAALLTDYQYMMWVPMVLVPYAGGRLLSSEFRSDQDRLWRLLVRLSLAALVFFCLALLYPLPQLLRLDTSGYPQASLETAYYYSLPISAFFRHREHDYSIGLILVPLMVVVWTLGGDRKGRWVWLLIAGVSLLLALGPYLSLEPYSDFRLSLPYLLLHNLLRGQYRTPVRFAFPAVFGLSVFIALQGQAVLDRFRLAGSLRLCVIGALLGLVVLDYRLLRPFPIFLVKDYAVYQEVAEDPSDVVLIEVPMGLYSYAMYGNGERLIYYQATHEKRIPSGALSRMNTIPYSYYRSFDFFEAIAQRADLTPAAEDELAQLVEEWNIGYVIVHRDMLDQGWLQQLPPFFTTHPSLCFWRAEGELLAYRTRPPEGCPRAEMPVDVNLGSSEDAAHVGTGWYLPENIGGVVGRWTGGIVTSTLRYDPSSQDYRLRFRAWAYPPDQVVTVRANDVVVAELPMPETWTIYTATIPVSVIELGQPTLIQLNHAILLSANERTQGESPDGRPLGAAYDWVSIEPCEK